MQFPLGAWFLVLVGAGIAVYGMSQLKMTWDCRFDDDLDEARVRREARWLLTVAGWALARAASSCCLMGSRCVGGD